MSSEPVRRQRHWVINISTELAAVRLELRRDLVPDGQLPNDERSVISLPIFLPRQIFQNEG
jgi:hypothetical protein